MSRLPQQQQLEDDEWEYEYSSTETETYYLTLDLSVRDFLERRPDDKIIHNTRGGYRVWYNPLFNAQETGVPALSTTGDDPNGDGASEREPRELDQIGLPQSREEDESSIDPLLKQAQGDGQTQPAKDIIDEIQILDLHSQEPLVSYRNHVFRGTWYENIGTEMIFTPHDEEAPLPALRNLNHGIDLLAASAARVHFKEATLTRNEDAEVDYRRQMQLLDPEDDEEIPERYKQNGGVYIHVGGDKTGQRQPQAHFLEDLIALKRSRGETDEVTVLPLETKHNELMVDDEEEEKRRKKLQVDQARAIRWREIRKRENGGLPPFEDVATMKAPEGRRKRGGMRGRGRRPLLLRRQPSQHPQQQQQQQQQQDMIDPALESLDG